MKIRSTMCTLFLLSFAASAFGALSKEHVAFAKGPQLATVPFAFGGIKVVPKGDLTFRPSDELWYFIRNPGIDTATSQPKVSMTLAGAMPPSTLKPGSYAIGIHVTDETLGKSYDLKESFRVVE